MMLTLTANLRALYTKSATRRLRRNNKCPAIIYGGYNQPNVPIELYQKDMQHPNALIQLLKNNTILLNIEHKKSIVVKIQAIQHHPFKLIITHIDFIRTSL